MLMLDAVRQKMDWEDPAVLQLWDNLLWVLTIWRGNQKKP